MKTILLTGARAPVTLDLARALHQAGHRVIGAESAVLPLSRRSNAFHRFLPICAPNQSLEGFKLDLIRIIQEEKVDVLIPTCEEVFHLSQIQHELPCALWIDEPEKLARLHNKFSFNQYARELGFQVPETIRISDRNSLAEAVNSLPGTHAVLKPEYSRFASKTIVGTKAEVLKAAQADQPEVIPTPARPWVAQAFLSGPEYCTYALADQGRLVAQVTYSHEFTAGRGAGICFEAIEHPAIETWVRDFVRATSFHGQIAFDFIEDENGVVRPLECNPRATSGLHLIAHQPEFLSVLTRTSAPASILVKPRIGSVGQIRLAMAIYGLASINSWKRLREWVRVFFTAREVVFSKRDLYPFIDQFLSFQSLILSAKKNRISPLEASTRDIEWNGSSEAI